MDMSRETETRIVALTGFLGSGKTTLLKRLVDTYQMAGLRVAVVINELGEVNIDGTQLTMDGEGREVMMRELLGGCICCSVRGELGVTLLELIERDCPDVVLIEATGAANPLELMEVVSETSMLVRAKLAAVITVVDSVMFSEQASKASGKTWRLLREQVRGASLVLLNKVDQLSEEESKIEVVIEQVRACNGYAPIVATIRCAWDADERRWWDLLGEEVQFDLEHNQPALEIERPRFQMAFQPARSTVHDSHLHLLVLTYYLKQGIESAEFTQLMNQLPANVYRAKGIVRFADTGQRVMFQYAYRQLECLPITNTERAFEDVIVLIGEGLHRQELDKHFTIYQ
jgi:G3E family GTPase